MKTFKEFFDKGVIKKIMPNISRARDLFEESERKERSLNDLINKIRLSDDNANDAVEYCYDIILNLIRAKMYIDGFQSSGIGSHEAEVTYMKSINFSDREIETMDELRYFRNGIKYYGKRLDKEYALKIILFTKETKSKLKKLFSF